MFRLSSSNNVKNLLETFFHRAIANDVKNNHELFKVNVTIIIGVVHPEDPGGKVTCVHVRKATFHPMIECFLYYKTAIKAFVKDSAERETTITVNSSI